MGLVIGKLGFGPVDFYYGLETCIAASGRETYLVDTKTASACDVLLVTLYWYYDVLHLERFMRQAGIGKGEKNPIIIAGGLQATCSPELLAEMVDFVFIGDGEDHLGAILDQIERGERPESPYLYSGGGTVPAPAVCKPRPFVLKRQKKTGGRRSPQQNWFKWRPGMDMADKPTMYRTEIARGCKYKCPFCLMSGLKPYCEVTADDVIRCMDDIPKGSHVGYFAPDRASHSEWDRISEAITARGFQDFGSDIRLEHLEKAHSYSVTLGIEGISKRLRDSIHKGWSDDFIIEKIGQFATTGIRRKTGAMLVIYYIGDLPGETEEDWEELRLFYRRLEKQDWALHVRIRPILNLFSPRPFTPMAGAEIHPFRDYRKEWSRFLAGGDGESRWGIRVFETRVWNPWERTMDMLITRGGAAAYKVLSKLPPKLLKNKPKEIAAERYAKTLIREVDSVGISEGQLFGE